MSPRRTARGVSQETLRQLALALPGMEEGTSYGTTAYRVRKKLLARLREDGETLVLRTGFDERELLMQAAPKTFFVTDHYRDHPMVLVRLANVRRDELAELLERAWRRSAPRSLVAQLEREA